MKWTPVDIIIGILTFILVWFLVLQSLFSFLKGIELDEKKAEIVGGLISSILAVITLYIGSKLKGKND